MTEKDNQQDWYIRQLVIHLENINKRLKFIERKLKRIRHEERIG